MRIKPSITTKSYVPFWRIGWMRATRKRHGVVGQILGVELPGIIIWFR